MVLTVSPKVELSAGQKNQRRKSRKARPWRFSIQGKKEGQYIRQRGQRRKSTLVEISQAMRKHLLGLCWELADINIMGPKLHLHRSGPQAG